MKSTALFFLLTVLCAPLSITAQSTNIPTLKGHALGESPLVFLNHSPALRNKLNLCRRSNQRDMDGALALMNGSTCEQLLQVDFLNPTATFTIVNPVANALIDNLSQGIEELARRLGDNGSAPSGMSNMTLDFIGSAHFSKGHLVMLEVDQANSTWSELEDSLVRKFGRPVKISSNSYQNGYGARFELVNARWVHSNYSVLASELLTQGLDRFVQIVIMTPEEYQKHVQQEAQSSKENSLD